MLRVVELDTSKWTEVSVIENFEDDEVEKLSCIGFCKMCATFGIGAYIKSEDEKFTRHAIYIYKIASYSPSPPTVSLITKHTYENSTPLSIY